MPEVRIEANVEIRYESTAGSNRPSIGTVPGLLAEPVEHGLGSNSLSSLAMDNTFIYRKHFDQIVAKLF